MPFPLSAEQTGEKSRSFGAGFAATILVTLSLFGAYWLFHQATRSAALVKHTLEVKRTANELLTLTLDAESGHRGYLLVGDRMLLVSYEHAIANIESKIRELQNLTSDNPRQVELFAAIRPQIEDRIEGLKRSVERIDNGDREAAMDQLRTGRGRDMQEKIRQGLRDVIDEEHRILTLREADVERARILSVLPMFLALLGIGWLGWQETQRRNRRVNALRDYNARLDMLVRQRTRELQQERNRVEALLRDVTHRVGNNLAMIASLLNMQRRRVSDPRVQAALEEVASRIQAMAAGQRRMNLDIDTDEVDGKQYLEDMIAELHAASARSNIAIETRIDPLRLPGKDAVSYLILLNELVTNAIKHAFPDGIAGKIAVTVSKAKHDSGDAVVMVVEDDGVGADDVAGASRGLGRTVLRSLLQSLDGAITYERVRGDPQRPGLRVTLRLGGARAMPGATGAVTDPVSHDA